MTYQRPSREQTEEWRRASAWWRHLSQQQRLWLRRHGCTSIERIVAYYGRGGR